MKRRKTTYQTLIPILLVLLLSACSSNKLITGKKHFKSGEYFRAIENLREIYPKLKDREEKAEVVYMLGNSYQNLGEYTKAIPWLKNAMRYQYPDEKLPLTIAETTKAAGKFEESVSVLEGYLKTNPDEIEAQNCLKGTELFTEWEKEPTHYLIERDSRLNSSQNERSISFMGDEEHVAVTTSREEATGKGISSVDGQKFADVFVSEYKLEKQNWEFPTKIEMSNLNSEENESHISFSSDHTKLVIVRSNQSDTAPGKPQLYFSEKINEEWSPLQIIPFTQDGAEYPQASWSADGKAIYFSSNKIGGSGGFDIWRSKRNENGEFEKPINLGAPINTPGNEIYPFERHPDILYFSSDFHPGAGAQDIFKASRQRGQWIVKNMELPINSFADDMGIIFTKEGEKGFFISNRKGSRGLDIYHFHLPPRLFMCFGKVYNEETDSIIPNVNIRVVATDGSVNRLVTNNGKFQVELLPDNDYTLIAYKKGFLNAQAKISTKNLNEAKEFQIEFKQTPTDQPIRLEQIYYETGKWELLPSSKKSLDELVEILNINPEIRIEVSAHTDEVGDESFNLELSQKRANEVVEYLKEKGIAANRLLAKGYGEKKPFVVNAKVGKNMMFLKKGDVLTADFISKLKSEQQEIAKSLNRRTEFEVINK